MNNACRSQADGVLLEVIHFASSVHKSTKHFNLSFVYMMVQRLGMISLMMYVHSATSTHSEKR